MNKQQIPPPPPGFVLIDGSGDQAIPQPPPGFEIIPPEEVSAEPKRSGIALNATAGVNDAIYSTLGAPVDLARGAINLGISGYNAATGSDVGHLAPDSFMGKEWIKSLMGDIHPVLDPNNTEATTTSERLARGAGEGVGYTVAPQVALGGASRAIGGKALEAASNFVGKPGSIATAGRELAAGMGAGVGATGAAELTPDRYDGLAATVGGLGGGIFGAGIAAAPMIGRAAWNASKDFIAPMTEAGRQRLAGQRLAEAATDPAAVRQALNEGVDSLVPGSEPTTFQATGDLGIGNLERGAAARRPDLFAQRRADQNAARVTALGGIQEKGAPEAVTRAVREHLARIDGEKDAGGRGSRYTGRAGARSSHRGGCVPRSIGNRHAAGAGGGTGCRQGKGTGAVECGGPGRLAGAAHGRHKSGVSVDHEGTPALGKAHGRRGDGRTRGSPALWGGECPSANLRHSRAA